ENQIFNKDQEFKRGYEKLVKNKNVLIVEDLTTTGGSLKKVIGAVRKAGGKRLWACVMVNRNPDEINSKTIGVQFSQLGIVAAEAFDEDECPYCKIGRPINTTVGHGKEYLKSK
ncbi:hypothetical protein M1615_03915, partial [Patescibacteria group bacterium]|nr:hypothetical protein [Patescibacteria group bacterium]